MTGLTRGLMNVADKKTVDNTSMELVKFLATIISDLKLN